MTAFTWRSTVVAIRSGLASSVKVRAMTEAPSDEVLVITSRLLRLATESSMTWVTRLSTSSGPAPG